MGTIEEMLEALKLIPGRSTLIPIEGAGHDLASARTVGNVTTAFRTFVTQ
jgi:hypothetical protein